MNLSDIALLNIESSDYCCIVSLISKTEATNLLQNADLTEKKWNVINQKILEACITMEKTNIKFGDIEIEIKHFTSIKDLFQ